MDPLGMSKISVGGINSPMSYESGCGAKLLLHGLAPSAIFISYSVYIGQIHRMVTPGCTVHATHSCMQYIHAYSTPACCTPTYRSTSPYSILACSASSI